MRTPRVGRRDLADQGPDGAKLAVYQFKVTLGGIDPPIWRRFQVTNDITLHGLHLVLQEVMGWSNDHLYEFVVRKVRYGEPDPEYGSTSKNARTVRLWQVLSQPRTKVFYQYDFGDCWEHGAVLEKVLPPCDGADYPMCLEGARACPPEDCGGVYGYERLQAILKDPENSEYEEMKDWVGGELDPEAFDLEAVNWELKLLRRE
ncbi:MAG: plasmid pRiA4b ORF-3 family protein [Bacillota bacterium]|nr:plasmid pRiA4b ORF-3 family protein [Bacillota bacterium]